MIFHKGKSQYTAEQVDLRGTSQQVTRHVFGELITAEDKEEENKEKHYTMYQWFGDERRVLFHREEREIKGSSLASAGG